ncbi:DUF975 family protein [Metaclostridioides mangenotii]|uniref:DUF975 family protein n=1 Tax=Metaclostridioides mangenotii TaxID=1540 RepID=A0ABS4EBE6_9FIRM|nr:DUF975 family protein [Clostridioides mangenotii]MBP1855257.1 hypothetical protein [Clostridioides mangenotii]
MVSFATLKERSRNQLKGHLPSAILVVFLSTIVLTVTERFEGSSDTSSLIVYILLSIFLAAPIYVGKIKFMLDLALGKNPKISEILFGFKYLSKSTFLGVVSLIGSSAISFISSFLGYLITSTFSGNIFLQLLVIIFGICLIVASYYIVVLFSMSYYMLSANPDMPITSCISSGMDLIIKGHVLDYLLLGLSFILWIILPIILASFLFNIIWIVIILCVIPYVLWLSAYIEMTYINFYLELNNSTIE